jgi:hypothetical protein
MSKYILGQSHQGNPVVSNYTADDTLTADNIGCGVSLNASGKVVLGGSNCLLGVLADYNKYTKTCSVVELGQKVLVKTNGTNAVGSPANLVSATGLFTSATGDVSSVGIIVGQDSTTADETLPSNTALINVRKV